MEITVDDDMLELVVEQSLRWHYNLFLENSGNLPFYSDNGEEEAKQVKKMLKALKRVHNYYAPHSRQL